MAINRNPFDEGKVRRVVNGQFGPKKLDEPTTALGVGDEDLAVLIAALSDLEAEHETVREKIELMLTDEDFIVRCAAIEAGLAKSPLQVERALTDKNSDVRWAAIQSGLVTTVEQADRALSDEAMFIRIGSIEAGLATTPEQVRRVLSDPYEDVRNVARRYFADSPPKSRPVIVADLGDG